ncbi:MAG: L-aspartate oxidase [Oligoflexia bacterium]|nr:L-aspartate oxidase [Oligoflexia bacterium]
MKNFLVMGTGIAGLFFALKASKLGKVTVLAKEEADHTATAMAQGGIASVTGSSDSFESHIQDTLVAGAGLCHESVVKNCIEQAPARIQELVNFGVQFDRLTGKSDFDLTKEGGHSHHRILHSFDQTGRAIQNALLQACMANTNIEILEHRMAVDLILTKKISKSEPNRCLGAYVLDVKSGKVETFLADHTILATGGAGKVYLYTSNWEGATGDGIAMAFRAGARVANMEFLQFHPTCLYSSQPKSRNFLITEALRGEGARLLTVDGKRFMEQYDARLELAPRDIVARAIDAEIKKSGREFVHLDISHKPKDETVSRFPGVYERCLEAGVDITRQPIPVVPAAHYLCGGVITDIFGRTDIDCLWALGETACTGLHGANRLASNSLLEGIAFAHNAVEQLSQIPAIKPFKGTVAQWDPGRAVHDDEMVVVSHNWDEVRRLMWNYVGIVRTNKRLERALHRILVLQSEIRDYYWHTIVNKDLLELRNIALVAELIIRSALKRKESRGIHYNLDYPEPNPKFAEDTVLEP